jgi:TolB protein
VNYPGAVLALLALLAGNGVIAFAPSVAAPAIAAFDPATGTVHQLVQGSTPAWSPDGTRIAYDRGGQVYVANADGTNETVVGAGTEPSWSPDGSALAVSRADGFGVLQIYVLGTADGTVTQLTFGTTAATFPSWSPDGKTIVFDEQTSLAAVPAQGGSVRAVPFPLPVAGGAAWSPDGAHLAVVATNGQVGVANADGSSAHELTFTLFNGANVVDRPAWAPDGSQIAWTQGSDLCLTDLAGNVRRLTYTQQGGQPVEAAFPAWQPRAASTTLVAASPGASNVQGCDYDTGGVRIAMLDTNVSSQLIALKAPQELDFVNHTTKTLTVSVTLHAQQATVQPGGYAGFKTEPGTYEFSVAGYPDGVPRRGTFDVAAAGHATIDEHAAIAYGSSTAIGGIASGPAGSAVTVAAQVAGAAGFRTVATLTPAGGRWRLTVAPRITTTYRIRFAGDETTRILRVEPKLAVSRGAATVRAALSPGGALAGRPVYLFRLTATGAWSQARQARLPRSGVALFRRVPPGRYYVGYEGDGRYWSTASEPFTLRS